MFLVILATYLLKFELKGDYQGKTSSGRGCSVLGSLFCHLQVFEMWQLELMCSIQGVEQICGACTGHAAALLGDRLYIVGGGNNSSGCADLVCLDLSGLATGQPLRWSPVTAAGARSAIASEGLSLTSVRSAGALVAFGGYNGKYHNTVHVYRPDLMIENGNAAAAGEAAPATAAAASSSKQAQEGQQLQSKAKSARADANGDAADATTRRSDSGHLTIKASSIKAQPTAGGGEASAAREEAAAARREAAAAKEAAASELALMRRQLSSAQSAAAEAESALADAERRLEATGRELEAATTKAFKLEFELAEARKALQSLGELEKEVSHYRKLAKEAEANKGKGGLWGYISGQ